MSHDGTWMQVLDAVMRYSDRNVGEEAEAAGQQVEVLHWAAAIDDTGQPHLLPFQLSLLCGRSLGSRRF